MIEDFPIEKEKINWEQELKKQLEGHPKTDECEDMECAVCAYRDCPHHDCMHYHHDGCQLCIAEEEKKRAERK